MVNAPKKISPSKQMVRIPLSLKVKPRVKCALQEAAEKESRTVSMQAEMILAVWLNEKGFLS